jgi:hypothetical protein
LKPYRYDGPPERHNGLLTARNYNDRRPDDYVPPVAVLNQFEGMVAALEQLQREQVELMNHVRRLRRLCTALALTAAANAASAVVLVAVVVWQQVK